MKAYVLLDKDYDLPLGVFDTAEELARYAGIRPKSVHETMSRYNREGRPCRYIRVEIDEEEDKVVSVNQCPECGKNDSIILDSEVSRKGKCGFVRRRRECQSCGFRWSTMEVPLEMGLKIIKAINAIKSL